jgi:hypothetical protein
MTPGPFEAGPTTEAMVQTIEKHLALYTQLSNREVSGPEMKEAIVQRLRYYDRLKAEVERLKTNCPSAEPHSIYGDQPHWKARAEKAEAELKEVRSMNEGMIDLLAKREAELDAARPLIEAVMKLEQVDFDAADDHGILTTEAEALFDTALAYRSLKDAEGKGGDPFDDNLSPEERAKEEEQLKYDAMERRHEQSVEDAEGKEKT